MITQDFNWDKENTKSRFWDSERGGQVIKEFAPVQIVKNPNYHQIESVVSALCKVVAELVSLEEARTQRMLGLYNNNPDQLDLFKTNTTAEEYFESAVENQEQE
jgi:hypothetical protein